MLGSYLKLILSTFISGSLGIIVLKIPLNSSQIVMMRTLLGGIFLLVLSKLKGEKTNKRNIIANLKYLVLSGMFFSISSILLFESYNYTSVGVASLTYYLAPVVVLILSPVFLKEKLTREKIIGVFLALIGTVLVNGINFSGSNPKLGFILALGAAITFAFVIIINKRIKGIPILMASYIQFFIMSLTAAIYLVIKKEIFFPMPKGVELGYLLFLGFVNTGIALGLYMESLQLLPAQSVALVSYVEPLSAVLLSSFILKEGLIGIQIIGALLMVIGALYGEFGFLIKERNMNFNSIEE